MIWNKKQESEEFYNTFLKKLLYDYINGNPRTEAAISFFLSRIDEKTKNVLDIGCGIGWSSYEMAINSYANIIGIDLSKKSIEAGAEIFTHERLKLYQKDILSEQIDKLPFDIITLLDVFEHIPKSYREYLYKKINLMLATKAKVLITCPSIFQQSYLKKQRPEGLQPVDEDIDLEILSDFASSIHGQISYFSYKHIWHKNDYIHCCIERGTSFYDKRDKVQETKTQTTSQRIINIKKSSYKHYIQRRINYKTLPIVFIHNALNKIKKLISSSSTF